MIIYHPEYLAPYHDAIIKGLPCVNIISGDSTSSAFYSADPRFTPIAALPEEATRRGIRYQTFVDASHPATTVADWASTFVVADMALNPNLYMPRWGINKMTSTETVADFAAALETGLQYFRAHRPFAIGGGACLLQTPNMVTEDSSGRNEAWINSLIPEIIRLGAQYQCTVADLATTWSDAQTGTGIWLDNPSGDGGIHPNQIADAWIYSAIADLLWPSMLTTALCYGTAPITIPPSPWATGGSTLAIATRTPQQVTCGGLATFPTTSIANLSVIANLPVGYRPRAVESGSVVVANGSGYYHTVPVQVAANGVVQILEAVSGVNTVMFGGLQFIPG